MPSSRFVTIPYVLSLVKDAKPKTILDVGVGFGKFGYLFREYTDIIRSERDSRVYAKESWKTIIDGIEGFQGYLHEAHRFVYDQIHEGNAADVISGLGHYDVVFLGDVIEHFPKEDGIHFLQKCLDRCNDILVLTTPKFETGQRSICDNPLEMHRSVWSAFDFHAIARCKVMQADYKTYVVAYSVSGRPLPRNFRTPIDVRLISAKKAIARMARRIGLRR